MKRNRRRRPHPLLAALRRGARIAAYSMLIAGAAVGVVRLLAWAKQHPYFAVREIDVEGRAALDPAKLLGWAGVAPGMSVWDVDEEHTVARLLAHPRILAAEVERSLPSQVKIRVEERRAVAILFAAEPLLVARDGVAFAPEPGDAIAGLPYVTGVTAADAASPQAEERLRRAARFVSLWQAHETWPALSEIRADADETTAFPAGTRVAVRFGAEASGEELARFGTLLELWQGREAQLSMIDLSLPGQAIVRLRSPRHGTGRAAVRVAGANAEAARRQRAPQTVRGSEGGAAPRRGTTT